MKLNIRALALSGGIVWGLCIFVLTYWFLLRGYEGTLLIKISNVYLGYSVTWYGAFVGLVWGFIDGFVAGAVIAWLYNKFSEEKASSI